MSSMAEINANKTQAPMPHPKSANVMNVFKNSYYLISYYTQLSFKNNKLHLFFIWCSPPVSTRNLWAIM